MIYRYLGYIPSLDALLLIRCCGALITDATPEQRTHLVQEIWSTLNTLSTDFLVSQRKI